ncbi:MAG TPA: XRE family transcriptional regulator [Gammaproteobacteria bacterium]|nr:XRE family transcriptional regulator [Gammaproteobacteria bacterium]
MAQRTQLVDTLKASLKAHGKTYADVAAALQLSETSIKRLFSECNFSLQRLDDICKLINMEISDLVRLMNESSTVHLSQLSEEQEGEIASDIALLLVTVCVLNRWTLQEIVDYFHLSETRCIRYLAKLDRLKLIELLPKNRVKLLIAPNFKWRENGPIQQFFLEKLEADFFNSRFNKEDERLIVINGMLADSSNAVFQRKMEHLAKEFDALNSDDAGLPLEARNGVTVVLAMRRWAYGLFDDIRKK